MPIEIYDKTINEADTSPVSVQEPVKLTTTSSAEIPQKRVSVPSMTKTEDMYRK